MTKSSQGSERSARAKGTANGQYFYSSGFGDKDGLSGVGLGIKNEHAGASGRDQAGKPGAGGTLNAC